MKQGDRVVAMAPTGSLESARRGTIAHIGRTVYIVDLDDGTRCMMAPWALSRISDEAV